MEKNLLYFLLGNIDMAKITTKKLIEISADGDFKRLLLEDLEGYDRFYDRCCAMKSESEKLKDVSFLAENMTKMSIAIKTMRDKSPAKMSGMLMDGFEMGISDAQENIKRAKADGERQEVISLATQYLTLLFDNQSRYEKFL
ncbi:MAG: hypothetical protein RR846_06970 [Oscillospiraceae bacterium]